MSSDELGNVGGGGGARGWPFERDIREGLERLPSDLSSSLARPLHDLVQVFFFFEFTFIVLSASYQT